VIALWPSRRDAEDIFWPLSFWLRGVERWGEETVGEEAVEHHDSRKMMRLYVLFLSFALTFENRGTEKDASKDIYWTLVMTSSWRFL
jgi:hypothetical protein